MCIICVLTIFNICILCVCAVKTTGWKTVPMCPSHVPITWHHVNPMDPSWVLKEMDRNGTSRLAENIWKLSGSQWPKSQVPFCSHASYPLTAAMKDWFRLCDTRGVQFILWCGLSVGRQMLPFLSCSERSLRPAMGHAGALQINFTNCISTGFGEICWLQSVSFSSCFCHVC